MKSKTIFAVTALSVALACSQAANGALLLGWHDFDNIGSTPETPDTPAVAGISGAFLIEGTPSWETGGSFDGLYGNSGYALPNTPGGDGHARVRPRTSSNGFAQIEIIAGDNDIQLEMLFFDLARASAGPNTTIQLWYGLESGVPAAGPSNAWGSLMKTISVVANDDSGAYDVDYDDFGEMVDKRLAANSSGYFTFWVPTSEPSFATFRLDNVGVGGYVIPEPGSLLGLGGVIGAGLFIRRRQRQ